jgi:hypothetical protein
MQISETDVHQGRYAARAQSAGTATFLRHRFYLTEYSRLCYRIWVKHLGKAAGQTDELMQFRDRFGAPIVTVLINVDGTLAYRNDFAGGPLRTSTVPVTPNVYHELQVCTFLIGVPRVETYFDGQPVPALTRREALGSNRVRELVLGDTRPGQIHHDVFDDVGAAASLIS